MSTLEHFRSFNFSEGLAYASITNNGVTFNKSVVLKLGCPDFVKLLIDDDGKQIAIQCCAEDEENAVAFYKQRSSDVISVRWNSRDLLNCLSEMMDWDLKKMSHRVEGKLLQEERAMLFDLSMATDMK